MTKSEFKIIRNLTYSKSARFTAVDSILIKTSVSGLYSGVLQRSFFRDEGPIVGLWDMKYIYFGTL